MIYQEKFELASDNAHYFSEQFDVIITGWREKNDERHDYFRNVLSAFNGQIYRFDTCENADKFSFRVESSEGIVLKEEKGKSLIPDLEAFLKKENFSSKRVCIDITAIKQALLFLLIKLFTCVVRPSLLFSGYTEPVIYKRRDWATIGQTEEYDLYDMVIGSSKAVPGFIKPRSSRDILLVAPIGFDSQRLQTIYENLKPKKLIPIVGFPSFVPGWNLTAIKMNYMILRGSNSFDMVENCEAASPFELYKLLTEIYHRHVSEFDVYVSPLGTRPHCLGAALFAANNPSVFLIYDFPVEKHFRSESVLKCNLYHLSKFIK